MTPHAKLKQDIFKKYGADPRCRIWNAPTGLFTSEWGSKIRVGITGQADIQGIRKKDGKHISIECKVGLDGLSSEQINWGRMIETYNGVWIECRSVDEIEKIL